MHWALLVLLQDGLREVPPSMKQHTKLMRRASSTYIRAGASCVSATGPSSAWCEEGGMLQQPLS